MHIVPSSLDRGYLYNCIVYIKTSLRGICSVHLTCIDFLCYRQGMIITLLTGIIRVQACWWFDNCTDSKAGIHSAGRKGCGSTTNSPPQFWLVLEFYVLATSTVIWGLVPTCDSAHSWRLFNAVPQAGRSMTWYPTQSHYHDTELTSACPILIIPGACLGSDKYQFLDYWFTSTRIRTHNLLKWETGTQLFPSSRLVSPGFCFS